jgi:hypothetical protein
MTTTKNTSLHTGEKKTPKKEENCGRKSIAEMLRERGIPVREVSYKEVYGDSVKVRIPFPRKK